MDISQIALSFVGPPCTAGLQAGTQAAPGQAASTSGVPEELPYTIAAPENYEDFAALVAGRSAADLSAAIQRITACNSLALASDNRLKLQVSRNCTFQLQNAFLVVLLCSPAWFWNF